MSARSQADERGDRRDAVAKWKAVVEEYQQPNVWRATWQLINTIGGYAALWYLSPSVS